MVNKDVKKNISKNEPLNIISNQTEKSNEKQRKVIIKAQKG
jgi:hypothetical protein